MKKWIMGLLAAALAAGLCGCEANLADQGTDAKPVIYLYPEEQTEVSVKLDYDGELTVTYPAYEDGWNVTAYPDGTLFDAEGNKMCDFDLTTGSWSNSKGTFSFKQENGMLSFTFDAK